MKKLPEHSPKPDTWERILTRGEFESQLGTHLPNLPQYQPKDFAWERITAELDRKKAAPVWAPWSIAAAVLIVLFLAGVNQEWIGKETKDHFPMSSSQTDESKTNIQKPVEEKLQLSESITTKPESTEKDSPRRKPAIRTVETIEAPKLDLPEMNLAHTGSLGHQIHKIPTAEPRPPKTLHQVSISWTKTKPGLQVKTTFGRKESELGQKTRASAEASGQLVLEINN